jgi:16S rRNA processing protein RimM
MNDIEVARLGKAVGLKGDLKLHNLSDFPEQFCVGATFFTPPNLTLEICAYAPDSNLVRFCGHENREAAQLLVNSLLYTSIENTRKQCSLGSEEFFWFDIEGCSIYEDAQLLGIVEDIERIGGQDYLHVKSDSLLVTTGLAKQFLIPYQDHFITKVDIEAKSIYVKNAKALLENL